MLKLVRTAELMHMGWEPILKCMKKRFSYILDGGILDKSVRDTEETNALLSATPSQNDSVESTFSILKFLQKSRTSISDDCTEILCLFKINKTFDALRKFKKENEELYEKYMNIVYCPSIKSLRMERKNRLHKLCMEIGLHKKAQLAKIEKRMQNKRRRNGKIAQMVEMENLVQIEIELSKPQNRTVTKKKQFLSSQIGLFKKRYQIKVANVTSKNSKGNNVIKSVDSLTRILCDCIDAKAKAMNPSVDWPIEQLSDFGHKMCNNYSPLERH